MNRIIPWMGTILRGRAALTAGALAAVLCSGFIASHAIAQPSANGDISDIITFGGTLTPRTGCFVSKTDTNKPLCTDGSKVPCGTVESLSGGRYWANGFDITQGVLAYDRTNRKLYLGMRTAGAIGDTDGNGNPNNNQCPPTTSNIPDGIGIDGVSTLSNGDRYEWLFDFDCNGSTDAAVRVIGNDVSTVQLAGFGAATAAAMVFSGTDIEVNLDNVDLELPIGNVFFSCGSAVDCLGEETLAAPPCPPGTPHLSITKTVDDNTLCPGDPAVFTVVVTNDGDVDFRNRTIAGVVYAGGVDLSDALPANLEFVSADNTCSIGPAIQVGQNFTWPRFSLNAGSSCTFHIRVRAGAQCLGAQTNVASVTADTKHPCLNGGESETIGPLTANATVTCTPAPAVSFDLICSGSYCPGASILLTGTATNLTNGPAQVTMIIAGESFNCGTLAKNETCTRTKNVTMQCSTDGQQVTFSGSATASTGCLPDATDPGSCSVSCQTPNIQVDKSVLPLGPVDRGTELVYTIVVSNLSKTVPLERVRVCDTLCGEVTFVSANPAPASNQSGVLCWNFASIAVSSSETITLTVRVRDLGSPECEQASSCTNNVHAEGFCADARDDSDASVTTEIKPCVVEGTCRFTGGGCLNEGPAGNRGHKQHTFGGNVSPCPTGPPGPTGDSWEHVVRNGHQILFNFHSWLPCITSCQVIPPGPCHPTAHNTRADFSGPGKYSNGSGSRDRDCHFTAYIIDHREGSCERDHRDEYQITVTDDDPSVGVVFTFAQQVIDCGNLQIHETPARLFGSPAVAPAPVSSGVEAVALLGRPYPNPFGISMSFGYEVSSGDAQNVEIGIYNVAGRLITRLASEVQTPGRYSVRWDGRDAAGVQMAPGVYFLKSRVGSVETTNRLLKLEQ